MTDLSRRALLQVSGAAVLALTVPIAWPEALAASGKATGLTPYLRIHADNTITALLPTTKWARAFIRARCSFSPTNWAPRPINSRSRCLRSPQIPSA